MALIVKHICEYEVGFRPHSRWERKEFSTHGEAEAFADKWRRTQSGGAWAKTIVRDTSQSADDVLSANVVNKYANKAFSSSKIF